MGFSGDGNQNFILNGEMLKRTLQDIFPTHIPLIEGLIGNLKIKFHLEYHVLYYKNKNKQTYHLSN